MTTRGPAAGSRRRPFDERMDATVTIGSTEGARILVVEDQDDVRRMLATALSIEGHHVDEASSATDGLKCLEQHRYDLVLSDYAMPGGTGSWMLHQASERGLLKGAIALIVTAHPDVRELEDVKVIRKPLDLDHFLEQIRKIVAESHEARSAARGGELQAGASDGCKVELVLYVSSASPTSIEARRNLERLLQQFDASQVRYTVRDLVFEPLAGESDRVTFTPTLVKRYPEPKMWVLGNLRESQIIADLLRSCGVDPRG